jgi:hypothetical protein
MENENRLELRGHRKLPIALSHVKDPTTGEAKAGSFPIQQVEDKMV